MARSRTCWTGILILLLPALCLPAGIGRTGLIFHQICKFCDVSSPVCEDDVCHSNCSHSSICSTPDDVCVAIWMETNNTVTLQTMCHNRTLPLEGVDPRLLLDFTSTECHMVSEPTDQGTMMVCGCDGEDCNDKLFFKKGQSGLQGLELILVVVISLSPVLVTIVTVTALYFYHKHQRK